MWKCSRCGACCKVAGAILPLMFKGENGAECKYLINNQCSIYDTRPSVCRVKDYSKEDEINTACKKVRAML